MWSWYNALHVLGIIQSQTSLRDHFVESDQRESDIQAWFKILSQIAKLS